MRRPLFVVAIATLLLPSVLAAQPPDADSKEAAHAADPQATPAATPGNHASSRSLMGMVMGALIQSAEQQSTSKQATGQRDSGKRDLGKRDLGKRDPGKAKPAASGTDPAARTNPATEKIAVQSEP
ncbi:MAG TPA: hypothetical protein VJW16_06760 [Lysobacter sp.]|nr:hypothetical protein [Lysobacter sp.]